jgi:hypothetical protein
MYLFFNLFHISIASSVSIKQGKSKESAGKACEEVDWTVEVDEPGNEGLDPDEMFDKEDSIQNEVRVDVL